MISVNSVQSRIEGGVSCDLLRSQTARLELRMPFVPGKFTTWRTASSSSTRPIRRPSLMSSSFRASLNFATSRSISALPVGVDVRRSLGARIGREA